MTPTFVQVGHGCGRVLKRHPQRKPPLLVTYSVCRDNTPPKDITGLLEFPTKTDSLVDNSLHK